MPGTRHLWATLFAGLLIGLMPGAAAASGLAGTSSSVEVRTALAPNAVFAAFKSNLTGSAARPQAGPEGTALERTSSLPERPETYQIAAAFAQETTAIFQASLTDSPAQALTPASLSVTPPAISLSATVGQGATRRRLDIVSLGGTVNWLARARILNGENWLRITPESGAAAAGDPAALGVEIDIGALGTSAGIFQGLIQVTDQASGFVQTVPVAVVLSVEQSRIGLSDRSFHFTIAGGGATPRPQTLRIYNRGTGAMNWSIPASAVPPWLTASTRSGSAGGGTSLASAVVFSVNGPEALALSSGVYQTLLPVQAPGANNSPQLVTVTLQRVPGNTPASPGIRPAGLVFVARQGGAAPAPKSFTVSNQGGGSLNAVFNASATSGGNWLSVGATGGTITAATGPLTTEVTVNPANLTPGFYRGTIRATFGGGEQLEVSVLLIVTPAPSSTRLSVSSPPALEGCTPDSMELIPETIGNGQIAPVSFPRVLLVSVIDSCGEFVDDATVVASVVTSSGTTTIVMEALGAGAYSGTWVPDEQGTAIPVSFSALHPTLLPVSKTFQVSTELAAEGIQLPVLLTSGVVEGAGFTPNRPLAPGGFISLFGSRFTDVTVGASEIPLERELGGVRVQIGDIDAPLHFVSPGQINAVLPVEFDPGANVSIVVSSNGVLTAPQSFLVAPAMPGIFVNDAGIPAIRRFVSAGEPSQPVTPQNPARLGDVLEIFATGLGETDPPVGSGDALATGSTVLNPVSVEIGGLGVPVLYQGLAPNFVGLYQVNVLVTDNIPTGSVQIRLIQNGIVGNPDNPAIITVVGQ